MSDTVYYLDYAAATPLDERVFLAMKPYFTEKFYNPSSPYEPAIAVRRDYQAAKTVIARAIGAGADELVMTAGATESINLAISSFEGHKMCSAIEHDSVLKAIQASGDYTIVPVDTFGRINMERLRESITDSTELVSVALANHEIGTIQSLSEIAGIIGRVREERAKAGNRRQLLLHCDASQGFGILDIQVARLGLDLLTLNAAKIYGPKQVGLLWVKPGVKISARIVGGGQELGLRSGTENVAGVIGFAEAIRLAEKRRKSETKRVRLLRDSLEKQLIEAFPAAVVSGDRRHRLGNYLNISFPGIDAERLVFMLEMQNVLVATGSACAANKATKSHVLAAIGLDEKTANGSLRLTLGRGSTDDTVNGAAKIIIDTINKEAARTGVDVWKSS